jgi:UDP-2,3-diacylglucosamine pyrophosphatase LpxH
MNSTPQFVELHVVSDLHLGGEAGFQIFNQGAEFKRLVDHLRVNRPDTPLALVINGDLVDFLAEPGAKYFDPEGAGAKLDRIIHDQAFVPVWEALRDFVKVDKRTLAITLGNHDLELALPWVREQLLQELSLGNAAARGRITLAFDGSGFRCRVGGATVLCLHGNEVDDWNITDYEALRRIGRDIARGKGGSDWVPNGGSRLVVDVMNGIKERYPFVDLLKPEVKGVLPTLLVLKPQLAARVRGAMPSVGRRLWDSVRRITGFLSEDDGPPTSLAPDDDANANAAIVQMLGDVFGDDGREALRFDDLDSLLEETEERMARGIDPMRLMPPSGDPQFLNMIGVVRNLITLKGRDEVLREALEKLGKDKSFDLKNADRTYRALNSFVGPDIDFLIAGHTHLERALPLGGPDRYYYNSGTWARLLRLGADVLGDKAKFAAFYNAVEGTGGMEALDQLEGVIDLRPAVVSIWEDGPGVCGELRRVLKAGSPPHQPVERSEFRWS